MCAELMQHFTEDLTIQVGSSVGIEVETSFLQRDSNLPISLVQSQQIFRNLVESGWQIETTRNGLMTTLRSSRGDALSYELGRQNLEISASPGTNEVKALTQIESCLSELYEAAHLAGAAPLLAPVLQTNDDLLVIPDERDAIWVALDGREALKPLATISSVQFTVEVSLEGAIQALNRLSDALPQFLEDYPQDTVWRDYIAHSEAGYERSRYGGPHYFTSMEDYVEQLGRYKVVSGTCLIQQAPIENVPLFIRSVWWYFRLRRYGRRLCIEVRPIARSHDSDIARKLEMVLNIIRA